MLATSSWLKQNRRKAVLLFGLITLFFTYYPGLDSPFLLDDWSNLAALSSLSNSPFSITKIIDFLANNRSGQLGRPISLLSFALQAQSWPDHPAVFKAVNLILHLLNGLLVIALCRLLQSAIMPLPQSSNGALAHLPLIVSLLWSIQPMHVSSVLYAVQRMTLLMSFFSLLALAGYLYGRKVALKQAAKGYWIMASSLLIGGMLAVFSKENGVLILLYLAALEFTLLSGKPAPRHWRLVLLIFVVTPIAGAAIYVLMQLPNYATGHAGRHFTLIQHLLTECRILPEYLNKILLPRPDAFGLFFDDYVVSTDLTSPTSTLFGLLLLGALLVSAVVTRKSQPVFSFAVLWFFAGHALESTVIPLELYFEHRNYLPSFGIIFGLCYYFAVFMQKSSSPFVKNTFLSLGIVYILGVWFICYQEIKLWANPAQQALSWQKNHPKSKRANELAYQAWIDLKNPIKADSYLQYIPKIDTKDSASYLIRLQTHCYINHISPEERSALVDRLKHTATDIPTATAAKSLVSTWVGGECPHLQPEYIEQALKTVMENTSHHPVLSNLTSTLSLLYAAENKYPQAFMLLDNAFKKMPEARELRLLKIRWAIANKQFDDALSWIAESRGITGQSLLTDLNFTNQLDIMEEDAKNMRAADDH